MCDSIRTMQLVAAELGFAAEQESQRSTQHYAEGLRALVARQHTLAEELFELSEHERKNAEAMAMHRDQLAKKYGGRKLPRWVFIRRLWAKRDIR